MSNRFELFHLSLLQRAQMDIDGEEFKDFTRAEWLNKVFTEKMPFDSYGSEFYYLPSLPSEGDDVVVGRLGRHVERDENLPPEDGFEEITREIWLASVIVLDPAEHEDGQKLAVQVVGDIGKPSTLVKNLVGSINNRYPYSPYSIEVGHIVDTQTFWNFVSENKGDVTSVSFDFIPPNMLGADEDYYQEMNEYKQNEKARKVKLSIENPDGINPETDRIKRATNYALEGRGAIKAKAKGNKRYNSDNEVQRTYVENVSEAGVELVDVAKKLANRILGRE